MIFTIAEITELHCHHTKQCHCRSNHKSCPPTTAADSTSLSIPDQQMESRLKRSFSHYQCQKAQQASTQHVILDNICTIPSIRYSIHDYSNSRMSLTLLHSLFAGKLVSFLKETERLYYLVHLAQANQIQKLA